MIAHRAEMASRDGQLEFFGVRPEDPNVAFLIGVLSEGQWLSAKEIIAAVYERTQVKWCDRKVRALAAAAKPLIISGQLGYRLTERAEAEEIKHCINALDSQGDEMKARAHAIRVYMHQLIWIAEAPR